MYVATYVHLSVLGGPASTPQVQWSVMRESTVQSRPSAVCVHSLMLVLKVHYLVIELGVVGESVRQLFSLWVL